MMFNYSTLAYSDILNSMLFFFCRMNIAY